MRKEIKNIMCLTDLSDYSNLTIEYGLFLARQFGSRLLFCHVVDIPSIALYAEAQIDPIEQQNVIVKHAEDKLEEFLSSADCDCDSIVAVGPTVSEISRIVEEKKIDLAISASHGRSGWKRLVLGSVTEELMRSIPCPLVVIRGPEEEKQVEPLPEFRLKKIMVGCDFSADSTLAFHYGASLAAEFEAELHLLHVIEAPAYKDFLKKVKEAEKDYKEELHEFLNAKLKNIVPEDARHWCSPTTFLTEGRPYEQIVKYAAEKQIDLVVLGVTGHGVVETLFVGSTTDRVARRAPCPILAVRPPQGPE